jgi:hypothetical protein
MLESREDRKRKRDDDNDMEVEESNLDEDMAKKKMKVPSGALVRVENTWRPPNEPRPLTWFDRFFYRFSKSLFYGTNS